MNKLFVAFLWHMHQPLYKDPITGVYTLPWVRLHSLKGYNDMLSLLEGFPSLRQTFNFVPSLIVQLEEYAAGQASDRFYDLSAKPADDLTPEERGFVLQNFFAANWDTMVNVYPRYSELLDKRGRRAAPGELAEAQNRFSHDDMRDLQVWFNLAWFGYAARDTDPEIRRLFEKGSGFSESDKRVVLEKQRALIRSLLNRYRAAQDAGQIEVSVSPFYHPILPLLCDFDSAREALPHITLPREKFKHPEDARRQVEWAISCYERAFGRTPCGMWPSEGSVSMEAARIVAEAGIRWIATDEEILLNTVKGKGRAEVIYTPYRLRLDGRAIDMVFRDKALSDLIGFSYSKSEPGAAARDLMGHLRAIRSVLAPTHGEHLVSIILDGENAWEYYPDGGKAFLSNLYSLLSGSDEIETVTIGDYLERYPPRLGLKRIFSGSWIGHSFNIWIGRREDNLAWELLARTRRRLAEEEERRNGLPPEVRRAAWNEIYAAEGSDWFWWYGDDFSSAFEEEFDRLFRSHLMHVHRLLGESVPAYLTEPIVNLGAARPTEQATGFVSPVIDGKVTHFYEWVAAGAFDVRRSGGAMNVSDTCVSRIYWGFDLENLYLRIDTSALPTSEELREVRLAVEIGDTKRHRLQLHLPRGPGAGGSVSILEQDVQEGQVWREVATSDRLAAAKVIELAVRFDQLGLKSGDHMRLRVTAHRGDIEIERWPRNGYLEVPVPDKNFEATMWMV